MRAVYRLPALQAPNQNVIAILIVEDPGAGAVRGLNHHHTVVEAAVSVDLVDKQIDKRSQEFPTAEL